MPGGGVLVRRAAPGLRGGAAKCGAGDPGHGAVRGRGPPLGCGALQPGLDGGTPSVLHRRAGLRVRQD
ncbi:MAG: hypothetical protein EBT96_07075, partial [Betaproteobacteria bacterium]|nr:hypothetical protein [Betaproteobacteria bacterium]